MIRQARWLLIFWVSCSSMVASAADPIDVLIARFEKEPDQSMIAALVAHARQDQAILMPVFAFICRDADNPFITRQQHVGFAIGSVSDFIAHHEISESVIDGLLDQAITCAEQRASHTTPLLNLLSEVAHRQVLSDRQMERLVDFVRRLPALARAKPEQMPEWKAQVWNRALRNIIASQSGITRLPNVAIDHIMAVDPATGRLAQAGQVLDILQVQAAFDEPRSIGQLRRLLRETSLGAHAAQGIRLLGQLHAAAASVDSHVQDIENVCDNYTDNAVLKACDAALMELAIQEGVSDSSRQAIMRKLKIIGGTKIQQAVAEEVARQLDDPSLTAADIESIWSKVSDYRLLDLRPALLERLADRHIAAGLTDGDIARFTSVCGQDPPKQLVQPCYKTLLHLASADGLSDATREGIASLVDEGFRNTLKRVRFDALLNDSKAQSLDSETLDQVLSVLEAGQPDFLLDVASRIIQQQANRYGLTQAMHDRLLLAYVARPALGKYGALGSFILDTIPHGKVIGAASGQPYASELVDKIIDLSSGSQELRDAAARANVIEAIIRHQTLSADTLQHAMTLALKCEQSPYCGLFKLLIIHLADPKYKALLPWVASQLRDPGIDPVDAQDMLILFLSRDQSHELAIALYQDTRVRADLRQLLADWLVRTLAGETLDRLLAGADIEPVELQRTLWEGARQRVMNGSGTDGALPDLDRSIVLAAGRHEDVRIYNAAAEIAYMLGYEWSLASMLRYSKLARVIGDFMQPISIAGLAMLIGFMLMMPSKAQRKRGVRLSGKRLFAAFVLTIFVTAGALLSAAIIWFHGSGPSADEYLIFLAVWTGLYLLLMWSLRPRRQAEKATMAG